MSHLTISTFLIAEVEVEMAAKTQTATGFGKRASNWVMAHYYILRQAMKSEIKIELRAELRSKTSTK